MIAHDTKATSATKRAAVDIWDYRVSFLISAAMLRPELLEDFLDGSARKLLDRYSQAPFGLAPMVVNNSTQLVRKLRLWADRWKLGDVKWINEIALSTYLGRRVVLAKVMLARRTRRPSPIPAPIIYEETNISGTMRDIERIDGRKSPWVRVPERELPSRVVRDPRTFLWLAGYQVCRWSYNALAAAADVDRSQLKRQIRDLAKSIELPLRQSENDLTQTAEIIRDALTKAY